MIRKGFVGIAGALFVAAILGQAYVGAQNAPAKNAPAKSTDQQKAAPAKKAATPPAEEKVMAGGGKGEFPAKTPTAQPATGSAEAPNVVPATLVTVHIPKTVMADGKALAAGSYQVRVTGETASPVKGTTTAEEHWVEFLQRGQVKGREIATVLTNAEAKVIAKMGLPSAGGAKVENLVGNEYTRVWINKAGVNYLVHLKNS